MPVVVRVANTFDELMEARDTVDFQDGDIEIVGVGIVTDVNRVSVGVVDLDDEKRRRLAHRYDPALFCVQLDSSSEPGDG